MLAVNSAGLLKRDNLGVVGQGLICVCFQAVEELLESLDLEKNSYHMGLSRVSTTTTTVKPHTLNESLVKLPLFILLYCVLGVIETQKLLLHTVDSLNL